MSTDNSTSLARSSTTLKRGALDLTDSPPRSPAKRFKPASASPTAMQSAPNPPSPIASQTSQNRDVFRFTNLAGELRNRIYECVLEDLTTTPDNPVGISACRSNPRTSALRKNVASCRLGDVSRTIRKEFAPMLRAALQHFSTCTCRAADKTGEISDSLTRDPARGMLELLRGRVQHLTFDKHDGACPLRMREMYHLGDALIFLKFKGQFKVIATAKNAGCIQVALSIYESAMSGRVTLLESDRAFTHIRHDLLYDCLMHEFSMRYPVGNPIDNTIVEKTFLINFSL